MTARAAVPADITALMRAAYEHASLYPHLTPEPEKVLALLRDATGSRQNFARVIERDGRIVSGLLACSFPHGWARKSTSTIMLWWSGERGDGRALLRAYREWVESRPIIRAAGLYLDFEAPEWLPGLMEAEGFRRVGGSMQWLRGVS
jgi:hypothetical protein